MNIFWILKKNVFFYLLMRFEIKAYFKKKNYYYLFYMFKSEFLFKYVDNMINYKLSNLEYESSLNIKTKKKIIPSF